MGRLEEVLAMVDNARRVVGRNASDLFSDPAGHLTKITDALRNTNASVAPVISNGELTKRPLSPAEQVDASLGSLDFGGGLGVIKPKGGNWLSGQVEGMVKNLRKNVEDTYNARRILADPDPVGATNTHGYDISPTYRQELQDTVNVADRNQALNQWIEGPLTKYIKRDMGAPSDPIRALADQGILHVTPEQLPMRTQRPDEVTAQMGTRRRAGFPAEGMAQTDLGKAWESAADRMLGPSAPASYYAQRPSAAAKNPWLATVPPETPVYSPLGTSNELGFNHIVDELSNSLREGRLTPQQLQSGNFSVDAAVRHVAEVNALRAKKAQEALAADMEGMPLHKDYPEQGYSWRQLQHEDEPTLQKWLTQEGDAMGHCVGGYCPDVKEGRSNIFSLRDAKGQPHVTIETQPYNYIDALGNGDEAAAEIYDQIGERLTGVKSPTSGNMDFDAWSAAVDPIHDDILAEMGRHYAANPPVHPDIVQIKGKGNAAPNAKYLPFVQDFIRSGKWSDIQDAQNTGLTPEEINQLLGR